MELSLAIPVYFSEKVDLIMKAREAMLSDVQIYNNPLIYFKTESFIVLSFFWSIWPAGRQWPDPQNRRQSRQRSCIFRAISEDQHLPD